MTTDFDPEYYCEWCFEERKGKMERYVYLPNSTINNELMVKVCPMCDGPELIRLANMNSDEGDDDGE